MSARVDLKNIANELLSSGKAEVLIGYEAGTLPLSAAPLIIRARKEEPGAANAEISKLIFDARCSMNLVNLLHKFKGKKVAIVVKGCDSRSLVGLIQEKQVDRENVIVLGAPCGGVIDRHVLSRALGCDAIESAAIKDGRVHAVIGGAEKVVPLDNVIYPDCRKCPAHNPVIADYLVADPVEQPDAPAESEDVEAARNLSRDERWQKFEQEMKKCILCYACRNFCPACYCKECFADIAKPQLAGRTDDPADAMFFHLLRFMHLGGRCTGCGACVRACPQGVDLRLYNDFLRELVKKEYGFEAGMDADGAPPLSCFKQDDPNDFVM